MDLYIGNLPPKLEKDELKRVINFVLMPNNFRELLRRMVDKKQRITKSELDVIDKHGESQNVRYARAVIKPDRIARRVLQRMDHLTYQGNSLRVREYIVRDSANDRRCKSHKNLFAVEIYNRRRQERRSNV